MCGIIAAVSKNHVISTLLDGLRKLEYRGYDSAGLTIIDEKNTLQTVKIKGKVATLVAAVSKTHVDGCMGVAHTRWATHGEPSVNNAHPHISKESVSIVHNGIIENFASLKSDLLARGYQFTSDTDSEVIAHLFNEALLHSDNLLSAAQQVKKQLKGAFACALMSLQYPEHLVAIRTGSPLVVGIGSNAHFVASDAFALVSVTQRFMSLENNDIAIMTHDTLTVYDDEGNVVTRDVQVNDEAHQQDASKGTYKHYMLKEIYEQPKVMHRIVLPYADNIDLQHCFSAEMLALLPNIEHIHIVACGTSFHAGMVAKQWFETWAKIPTQVEVASEYRYRPKVISKRTLLITISQSGETADTLAALMAHQSDYDVSLAICNVPHSTLVSASDSVFLTKAGPEIGVASTKAFTSQLMALLLLALYWGQVRRVLSDTFVHAVKLAIAQLPEVIEDTLLLDKNIAELAQRFSEKQNALFLGRGILYPVAREGALKLKEISYIHAEAYPAGELKHGALALVDQNMPVIAVTRRGSLLEKMRSNLEEVSARGGELFVFSDEETKLSSDKPWHWIKTPSVHEAIAPIVYTIPLQLLAYHVAVLKGTDVDQPRNLAKSVTVE